MTTSLELSTLRKRPHDTKLWLSIYKPRIILACQVSDPTIAHEAREISYDNVTSGTYEHVRSGMTLLVGTSPGSSDKGRVRVKSATATQIIVAENSHIDWEDGLYLTVINYFEIWSVFPYYVQQGENVTWYKDYDIPYTNQNSDLGIIPCMGSHRAAFVGDTLYYSATGSVDVLGGRALEYSWFFEGGDITGSSLETPGYVQYNTPGHYLAALTISVTGSSISDTTYRHVSIYDRPGSGTNTPILQWEMGALSGSRDEGGYSAEITVYDDIGDIVDGALVILFSDSYYGDTKQSIGGNYPNNSSIFFVGYILDGTIKYDYANSSVSFTVASATDIMKAEDGAVVSLESVASPSDWYEIYDLDVYKFLYHYFKWHSTVLLTTDLRYIGENLKFQYQDSEPGSLFDVVNSFLNTSLPGNLVSDRQGLLWAETSLSAIDIPTGSIPVNMEILKQDWIDEPEIEEVTISPLAYLEMGGVAWSGIVTGTSEAYLAAAPGNVRAYTGGTEIAQGLILKSQEYLNTLVGNIFAYRNAKYPSVSLNIAGNYGNLDIAPQKQILLTVNQEDTRRKIVWNRRPFYITDISWKYSPKTELLSPTITLHEITQGFPGVTIEIPDTPIENIPDNPPIFTPDFPPFPIVPLPSIDFLPIPYIPPPPDNEVPPETCCSDLTLPSNYLNLEVATTIRSDGFYRNSHVTGWCPHVTLRSSSHTYPTNVSIKGNFLESNDFGQTWQPLSDDSLWHIYALTSYSTRVSEATVDISFSGGKARQFSFPGCIALGLGGGIEITVDKPGQVYNSYLVPIGISVSDTGHTGDETVDYSFYDGYRGIYAHVTDPDAWGGGYTWSFVYYFKLVTNLDPTPDNVDLIAEVEYVQAYKNSASLIRWAGVAGALPYTPYFYSNFRQIKIDNSGFIDEGVPGTEISSDGQLSKSWAVTTTPSRSGGEYYFALGIGINPRPPSGGAVGGNGRVSLVLRRLILKLTDGTTDDIFAHNKNVVRIDIHELKLNNICVPGMFIT